MSENEKKEDGIVIKQKRNIKFLNGQDDKNRLYKSFIIIVFSALCLSISLGMNEMFKLILDHAKKEKSNINEIGYCIIYIFVLLVLTLSMVYFLNVEVS